MSDNLQKRPAKGILKNSSSFDKQEHQPSAKRTKETKWDEMNIIATYHPPGKDYGHMKIDEPKTPYSYDDVDKGGLNPQDLAQRIKVASQTPPKVMEDPSDSSDDDDEEELTEEEKKKRKEFELKRKKHYNEFQALQMAKKLMENDDEEDDDDDNGAASTTNAGPSAV